MELAHNMLDELHRLLERQERNACRALDDEHTKGRDYLSVVNLLFAELRTRLDVTQIHDMLRKNGYCPECYLGPGRCTCAEDLRGRVPWAQQQQAKEEDTDEEEESVPPEELVLRVREWLNRKIQ